MKNSIFLCILQMEDIAQDFEISGQRELGTN